MFEKEGWEGQCLTHRSALKKILRLCGLGVRLLKAMGLLQEEGSQLWCLEQSMRGEDVLEDSGRTRQSPGPLSSGQGSEGRFWDA